MQHQNDLFGNIPKVRLARSKRIQPVNTEIPELLYTVNSLSGGKTSAYLAAHYPADFNVFSLVRIEDPSCRFPDQKIRKLVEDRIQAPFVGTAEDDMIIYTMLDLEQYLGQPIQWVSGITFDAVIRTKGGWLPNKLHRYCTTHLKVVPIFEWVWQHIGQPVTMRIGYRANEQNRAASMLEKLNEQGLLTIHHSFSHWENGRHRGKQKWEHFQWQKPEFPLIEDAVYKWQIENYWEGRPVRFAAFNNCVGCFHRNPILLRKMYDWQASKMSWFEQQEGGENGQWRSDFSYARIREHKLQMEIDVTDFSSCDSGYCGH